jgi:transposase InsO family protein
MDVRECDLIVVPYLARYNDSYRYILSAIDVFSKYLHLVPLKTKTGKAVAEAFRSILEDPRYSARRPLIVQTDKGREFLNRPFRDMLQREGIEHRTCKTPMLNAELSKGLIELSEINSTSTSVTKIRTDT